MSVCRLCQAEIIWAYTENGRRMPLDRFPVEDGNVEVVDHADSGELIIKVHANGQQSLGSERYVSHFVSCPHGGEWRRK